MATLGSSHVSRQTVRFHHPLAQCALWWRAISRRIGRLLAGQKGTRTASIVTIDRSAGRSAAIRLGSNVIADEGQKRGGAWLYEAEAAYAGARSWLAQRVHATPHGQLVVPVSSGRSPTTCALRYG
jgi:hypothetical protein